MKPDSQPMPKPTDRQYIAYLGEYYDDCWTIEAELKSRTKTTEGASLLCLKLQEREEKRNKMVQYLADKRGISFKEMWNQILTGKYTPLTPDELAKIQEFDPDELPPTQTLVSAGGRGKRKVKVEDEETRSQ